MSTPSVSRSGWAMKSGRCIWVGDRSPERKECGIHPRDEDRQLPYVIATPGHYQVVQDLVCPNGTAIRSHGLRQRGATSTLAATPSETAIAVDKPLWKAEGVELAVCSKPVPQPVAFD